MKKLKIFSAEAIAFPVALLGGRFPLWGLLYLYLAQFIPLSSVVCFGIIIIFLRGILAAREKNYSNARGIFSSYYKHLLRPIGVLIFAEIAYLALVYLFFAGNKADWGIFLAAFACYIVYFALSVLSKKKSEVSDCLIPRDANFHAAIFLLWLYVFLCPDGIAMLIAALTFIYLLEFLSILKVDLEKGVLLSRVKA
jgi:hypothetical protein